MKTTNSFSLSRMTDNDLLTLASEICEERARRERKRREERSRWIEGYLWEFCCNPNASSIRVGETTVVALGDHELGIVMTTATPVRGDVFDGSTGIAVAYAKAIGDKIPDYI